MKASDWIIDFFARRGVDTLYGYIGGMVTHLIDSASRDARVRFVQTYHEQSAAFAARGICPPPAAAGVAIATSGPGATNLLTGVANAYFDSIPVIYVTGQVNTGEYKYDKPIRQQGFQETDVVSMARPVTKYAVLLDRADRICLEFEKAWHLVQSGRPGPVLIDLPMDMQRQEIDPEKLEHFAPEDEGIMRLDDAAFSAVVEAIRHAARPLLLAGGGAIGATAALNQLSHSGIPIAVSLMGKGAVDEFTPGFVGMIGSYGNRSANLTVGRADLLVAIGSRLDTRQTGARREEFCKGKNIIQIDIDRNEMTSHRLGGRTVYYGDAKDFLTRLAEAADTLNLHPEWLTEIVSFGKRIRRRGRWNVLSSTVCLTICLRRSAQRRSPGIFLLLISGKIRCGRLRRSGCERGRASSHRAVWRQWDMRFRRRSGRSWPIRSAGRGWSPGMAGCRSHCKVCR